MRRLFLGSDTSVERLVTVVPLDLVVRRESPDEDREDEDLGPGIVTCVM